MPLDDLRDLGTRAIREDAPAGSPARDDPEFESLQREIRKLELPDGQQPDWSAVVRGASLILGQKSKDLLVAAYLGLALLQREGYAGLAVGLGVLGDMVDAHWESLYPDRPRGRAAAFDWLAERAAQAIEARPSVYGTPEELRRSLEALRDLMGRLENRVPGGTENLGILRRTLEEAESRATAPPPPPAAGSTPGAASGVAVPVALQSAEDAARALQQLRDLARRIGEFHRSSDPDNPLGYRLPRLAAWVHLKDLPPNVDGKTQIPPPQPADFAAKIAEMLEQGQWAGVLEQVETRFASAILWLDLHRWSAAALEGMGHMSAARAIAEDVAALLRRLPGLETLRFANDQPLADAATRAWIAPHIRTAPGGEEAATATPSAAPATAGGSAAETADVAELPAIRAQAQERWRRKRLAEGLALIGEHAARARTLRGRAQWELEAARLCMQAGRPETALAQLQALDETLRSSSAEDWAPELCAEVLKSLFLAHRDAVSSLHPRPAEEVERSREYRRRLGRIDIAAALSLEDKK